MILIILQIEFLIIRIRLETNILELFGIIQKVQLKMYRLLMVVRNLEGKKNQKEKENINNIRKIKCPKKEKKLELKV